MSEPRQLRAYGYVNRPYDSVRRALHEHPMDLLRLATTSAAARVNSLAAELHLDVGAVEIGVDVRIHVHSVSDEPGVAGMSPVTRISLGWEALRAPGLFPLMSARLSAWPLSSTETQLEVEGGYRPPLGPLGTVIDAAVGHRIAEASVQRLLEDLIAQLQRELPPAR